jgi:sulfide:quinone oxidoreductase
MIDETPEPALVYCRSGTRVTLLWAMIRAGELELNELLNRALENGYDIYVIKEDLEIMTRKT